MSTRHLLNRTWHHHEWYRRVVATDTRVIPATSIWGRPVEEREVTCRAEYVCDECGAIRDDGDCQCDVEKGERCPPRLALLEGRSTR